MQVQTKAIVLGAVRYAENGLVVNAYTEKFGRVAYGVKLSRTRKNALSAVYFMPLTVLDVEMDYRPNSDIQRIRECKVARQYANLPFDAAKNALTFFLAELLQKTLRTQVANEPMFGFLENSLAFLDATEESCANFHVVFLLKMARHLGFAPNFERHAGDRCFDMQNGCYSADYGIGRDALSLDDSRLMEQFSATLFHDMHTLRIGGDVRQRLLRQLLRYYQLHFPEMGTFRTLDVLETLFR